MKINKKLSLMFLGISIIPLMVFGGYSFEKFSESLIDDRIDAYEAILISEKNDIDHRIQLRLEEAKIIAGNYLPKQLSSDGINDPQIIQDIQNHIDSIYKEMNLQKNSGYSVIDAESSIEIIGIWDIDGKIVANTQRDLIGKSMPPHYIENVKERGLYFGGLERDPLTDENYLVFLSSIRNWETDEFSGSVLLKGNANILNEITTHFDDVDKKFNEGDIYLVDSKYRRVTDANNDRNVILTQNVESQVITDCFNGIETSGIFTNYQGKEMVGKTLFFEDEQWCLVAETELDLVLAEINEFRNNILIIVAMIVAVVIFLAIIFARGISIPILKLVSHAEKISQGDLDYKLQLKTKDEIEVLSNALNETSSQLKKIQKEKEDTVAMITHDLKQPLVPIMGYVELLKNPKLGDLNKDQKDSIIEIEGNVRRQLSMIDSLMSAQKLGSAGIDFNIQTLSTKEILNESIKVHSSIMKGKEIEFFDSSTEDYSIKADKRRVLEVLTNLIQNAHDFVPVKGIIEIGVNDEKDKVTFFVKDNGIGIPKEKQDQIFKKYGEIKTGMTRTYGGTGLGLVVSKELVEGMSGKIWLESEKGKGTVFLFTIPKA